MEQLLEHKELIIAGIVALIEIILRAKPGAKPLTKIIYDIFGMVQKDKK